MNEIYELVKEEYPNARYHAMRLIELAKNKTIELRAEIERRVPILVEQTKDLVKEWMDFAKEQYPIYVEQLRDLMENLRNKIESEYPQLMIKIEQSMEKIRELVEYLNELQKQISINKILALRFYRPFSSEGECFFFKNIAILLSTMDNSIPNCTCNWK